MSIQVTSYRFTIGFDRSSKQHMGLFMELTIRNHYCLLLCPLIPIVASQFETNQKTETKKRILIASVYDNVTCSHLSVSARFSGSRVEDASATEEAITNGGALL